MVYFFYPETAFRSLEEVDVIFALADEEPGNPWLSVVRISKNEPLWFGKRGEKRLDFQYQNSSWHKRFMGSSGSSGNGTGSDSNRVMNEKDQAAENFNRSLQPPAEAGVGTVTANCYAVQNNGYRPGSPESPIDPRLSPPSSDNNPPTLTMDSKRLYKNHSRLQHKDSISSEPTLIHHDSQDSADPPPIHRNKSERDTWYQSKESLASAEAIGTPVWHNADAAPAVPPIVCRTRSRSNASSPPSPGHYESRDLRPTSRGRQQRSRPTTADTQRSFLVDDDSEHHAITVDEAVETESLSSMNYPGRLDGDVRRGLHRTPNGRETYFPDGIVDGLRDGSVERSVERRLSNGSASARRFAPRDSGRAY